MDTEYEIIGISLYIPEKSNGRASVNKIGRAHV